ncbi:MAG: L,D-transpeptidase family protein [Methylococcales bacterium]|nr:L,D-transpeptidase family protein [Methylococcales bacterium]
MEFQLPAQPGDALVGEYFADEQIPRAFIKTKAQQEDTLLDVARRFDAGQTEILLLNPDVDRWLPGQGTEVKILNRRLLPKAPRQGVVINLPEYRLYYYRRHDASIVTHPISVGRLDWNTPLGKTRIVAKTENPTWTPPASIKKEHAERGDMLPNVVPAGPDNPLGLFAMRLGIPGYLIHSTNKPYGVGMSVTHGCIRMYPEDIERLFPDIPVGTDVYLVNQPIKLGWHQGRLFIEVHPLLDNQPWPYLERLNSALDLLAEANEGVLPVVNGARLKAILNRANGVPEMIYQRPVTEQPPSSPAL